MSYPRTLIIEGPDGAGKSSLIQQLLQTDAYRDATVVHHGPDLDKKEVAPIYGADLLDCREVDGRTVNDPRPLLIDRSWLSELIYAPAMGRKNRVTFAHVQMLERLAVNRQAILVLCLPPFEECRMNWAARKDNEYLPSVEKLAEVYSAYAKLFVAHQCPTYEQLDPLRLGIVGIMYDYTTEGGFDDFMKRLDNAGSSMPALNLAPGLGAWQPGRSICLVGDMTSGDRDLPFVNLSDGGGCSAWLADWLRAECIHEHYLYWVNAHDERGRPRDPSFLAHLDPPVVMALGERAERWLCTHAARELDWRTKYYYKLSHPQHHKRFFYRQPYPLLEAIRNEIRRLGP